MKARGKRALADVIYCCKMTSVMESDGITSFLRLKAFQIHVNVCAKVQLFAGILQYNGEKLKEAEVFKCVFVVYCVLEYK